MDSLTRSNGWLFTKDRLDAWRIRPNTGSFWKDLLFIFVILFIQTTILPSLIGLPGWYDLITPWLVVSAVRQKPLQATALALAAAFYLETKMAIPAGLYLCSYWIMINIFFQIRPALSWRYRTPWLASHSLALLWIILCEAMVLSALNENPVLTPTYVMQQLVRLLVGTGFGLYLSKEWMRIDAEEPVPQ